MMSQWIEFNGKWRDNDICFPEQYEVPNLEAKAIVELGFGEQQLEEMLAVIHKVRSDDEPRSFVFDELERLEEENENDSAAYECAVKAHPDNRIQVCHERRQKLRQFNEWYHLQPETKKYDQEYKARQKAYLKEHDKSFYRTGMAKAGVMVEFESNGEVVQRLIGHVNELGGVCNDCAEISAETTILRYRVVWNGES